MQRVIRNCLLIVGMLLFSAAVSKAFRADVERRLFKGETL